MTRGNTRPATASGPRTARCKALGGTGLRIRLTAALLVTGALAALWAAQPVRAEAAGKRPPNFLLILADDVGREVLGCYGGTSYPTPQLDRLAHDGLRFTHAYVMPVCHPTRVCLVTGRYPFRHGNPPWGTFPKDAERQTFAHVLRDAGYATAVAGKWQLTLLADDPRHPHRLGFDHYCLFGWHEGPRYYDPLIWQNGALRDDTRGRYGPDVYCEFLIEFMKRHRDRPFLAFYSMALCHDVTDDLPQPVPHGPEGRYQTYAEMAAAMDERVGRMVDAVDSLGLGPHTLILFVTDNGTPGRYIARADEAGKLIRTPFTSRWRGQDVVGGKGALSDLGTRVPLVARWTGTIGAGTVTDRLVDASDFLPTLAELAGAAPSAGVPLDGHSFADLLRSPSKPSGEPDVGRPRTWVFAEHRGQRWVRDHRWKLYADGTLVDMADDPIDERPIARDAETAEHQVARARLRIALDAVR